MSEECLLENNQDTRKCRSVGTQKMLGGGIGALMGAVCLTLGVGRDVSESFLDELSPIAADGLIGGGAVMLFAGFYVFWQGLKEKRGSVEGNERVFLEQLNGSVSGPGFFGAQLRGAGELAAGFGGIESPADLGAQTRRASYGVASKPGNMMERG